jgi:hypothetical protein
LNGGRRDVAKKQGRQHLVCVSVFPTFELDLGSHGRIFGQMAPNRLKKKKKNVG